ncbi:MAG: sporulation protein YtfJ [Firmicutes bacterium]|nr:sporulation protein YtfJ [Bacillota bacterium]
MSENNPIQDMMKTVMESLIEIVDVTKIVGEAVETPGGDVIIPVSRVSFGFAAGGSQFSDDSSVKSEKNELPFGGGSGAGVSLHPIAFLVVGQGGVRLLPVDRHALWDRLFDLAPQFINQLQNLTRKNSH